MNIFLKSKICCRLIRIHSSGVLCRFCKRSEKKKNLFTYFWSTRMKQLLIMMWKLLTSFILHPQVQCTSTIHITVSAEIAEDEHRPMSSWYHGNSLPWSHLPNNTKRRYSMYDTVSQQRVWKPEISNCSCLLFVFIQRPLANEITLCK